MTLKRLITLTLLVGFCFSCGKDDDTSEPSDRFYDNADTSVSENSLLGVWAIFNVGYQGSILDVPINYQDCGRDFFVFSENGIYSEYLFQDSACFYDVNTLNWELNNGVITLANQFNQSDDLVVTNVSNSELTFKSRLDVDDDGVLDIVTIYAQRYQPIEIDMVSPTFTQDYEEEALIKFNWQAYEGFNEFNRYEIYRSAGDNCNLTSGELIATITDREIVEFIDLNPVGAEYLCYYLRTYTNEGLLGQSITQTLSTWSYFPTPVPLLEPMVLGNTIEFNWQSSDDPYFSHYELAFSNYEGGSGVGKQEYSVAVISDVNNTSFTDESPPYLENPYYVIYVYNIFGNKTAFANANVTTYWEVDYKRDEIIGFQQIESYDIDPNEPVVYFYGRESGEGFTLNIHRFNYNTNETEAVSNLAPQFSTSVSIKIFESVYGKELFVEQASDLFVYDATTLEYKYTLDTGVLGLDDFTYATDSGYWILVDNDDVYTFARDNTNLDLVDVKPHFPEHQGSFNYKVFALNNNKVLVGHNNETNSYVYNLEADGVLNQDQIVPIPIKDNWENKTEYSATGGYIINYLENRIYSTNTFAFLESFEVPYFPTGVSSNGQQIFGSNNDPDWQITEESIHAKQAVIYDRITQQTQNISTIGYPHIIFENYNGDIMSISSGLKKDNIEQNINNKADLFIENIEQ